MKILVVGGGGREHAIVKAIKKNKKAEKIWAIPGNGGIAADAECVAGDVKNVKALADFAAENGVDFAVVAPDDQFCPRSHDPIWRQRRFVLCDAFALPRRQQVFALHAKCFRDPLQHPLLRTALVGFVPTEYRLVNPECFRQLGLRHPLFLPVQPNQGSGRKLEV